MKFQDANVKMLKFNYYTEIFKTRCNYNRGVPKVAQTNEAIIAWGIGMTNMSKNFTDKKLIHVLEYFYL